MEDLVLNTIRYVTLEVLPNYKSILSYIQKSTAAILTCPQLKVHGLK